MWGFASSPLNTYPLLCFKHNSKKGRNNNIKELNKRITQKVIILLLAGMRGFNRGPSNQLVVGFKLLNCKPIKVETKPL